MSNDTIDAPLTVGKTDSELTDMHFSLRKKRNEIQAEMAELRDAPETEGRKERLARLATGLQHATGDLDDVIAEQRRRVRRHVEKHGLQGESGFAGGGLAPDVGATPFATHGQQIRSKALRQIDQDRTAPDGAKHLATTLVEGDDTFGAARWASVAADPHYLTAFAKLAADPERGHLGFDERERAAFTAAQTESRAMSLTNANGGFMVPFTLDPAVLLSSAGSVSPFRQVCRTVTISTNSWNGISSAGITTSWDGEAAEVSDDGPTLAQPSIDVHKAQSLVPYSIEVGQDAEQFVPEMRRLLLDSKDQLEAAAFVSGTGSDQPTGIITALDGTSSELSPATGETFAKADVTSTIEALPPRFRQGAVWFAELSTINAIEEFETTNGARRFPGLANTPPSLLRRRVYEASELDAYSDINAAATADNFILLVFDPSRYIIVDRVGSSVELIPHLMGGNNRPTGQRALYHYWRVGADMVTDEAARVLNVATTA